MTLLGKELKVMELRRDDLIRASTIAGMLAFAGLPLYIHVPRFYAEEMGVNLAILGSVLLLARAVDSFQDPIIGFLADRWKAYREFWIIIASVLLLVGISLLFSPTSWFDPIWRLVLGLLAAFTGFSAMQIALYDHGLAQAEQSGGGYTRIALWREAIGIIGVCLAAGAPIILTFLIGSSIAYSGYVIILGLLGVMALWRMKGRWLASGKSFLNIGFRRALGVEGVWQILVFGFVNALPTALTSTLFLFFVADVLDAEIHAGPLLILFFVSAAIAAPFWARLADRIGRKPALATGMFLSVPVFVWTWILGPGDVLPFYFIVAASGAALGADTILVPAMLAARIRGGGGQVFSLWTFLQKSALALAAGVSLPFLAFVGYEPNTVLESSRSALATAYALVPCILKLMAIPFLLVFIDDKRYSE